MTKGKIIHTFQQRHQWQKELKELAQLRDERERIRRAQELAQHGEALLPFLLRHLDTTDPFLRGAIGLVFSFLPRDMVAPRLRDIAVNPARSDQERMTALMYLERFLNEPVEESIYSQLRNPDAVIEQSLREVIAYQQEVPDILLEYVAQLQEEPVDVALLVLRSAQAFPLDAIFPLLTLLVQDVRFEVAQAVAQFLEDTRDPRALPLLQLLAHTALGELREQARRAAVKLRMRGVTPPPVPDVRWRALVTPPDVHGSQAFWLIREEAGQRSLVGLLTNAALGVQFSFHLDEIPPDFIPPQPVGQLLPVVMDEDAGANQNVAWFLEVPLPRAREWLQRLVEQNYRSAYQLPLSYRHWGPAFWQETESLGPPEPLSLPEARPVTLEEALRFFQHPALHSWYVEPRRDVEREQRWIRQGLEYSTLLLAYTQLTEEDFPEGLWSSLAQALHLLAEWFQVAGESEMAAYAVSGAASLERPPVLDSPFAQALVLRGLDVLFAQLRQARDHWDEG
ncbi:MAG: hypothetical protein GXO55_08730 [Chloroflexi bacterium]|nr:hypothetical protein [Chloroflexota bacterium]